MTCSLLRTQLCKEPFKPGLGKKNFFLKGTVPKVLQPLKVTLKKNFVARGNVAHVFSTCFLLT